MTEGKPNKSTTGKGSNKDADAFGGSPTHMTSHISADELGAPNIIADNIDADELAAGESRQAKSRFFDMKNSVASLGKKLFKGNKRMSEVNEEGSTNVGENCGEVDSRGARREIREEGMENLDGQQPATSGSEQITEAGKQLTEEERLRAELEEANLALAAMKEDLLRSQADAINAQKRHAKERAQLLRYQGENFFREFLEFMDNLERAISSEGDVKVLREGVSMVYKSLVSLLDKWEIKSEDPLGQPFDHEKCAAISVLEGAPTGIVAQVLKKPFWYRDKLIRPGEVVVGK